MDSPLVSILIVNYNGKKHLKECLDSVSAQSYPRVEVVVVDNGSADDSREYIAREFPAVKLVCSGANLGFTGGNNFGGRHCAGDYIYFLNNDVRAEPDAVAALMRAREENPDFSIFGSLLVDYADPSKIDSAGDCFYWMGWTFAYSGYPAHLFTKPFEIVSAKGAAVLYPRKLLDRLGWFDDRLFLLFEDMDLALRARHLGARVLLVPQSRILHKGAASSGGGKSSLSFYYASRNYQLVVLKNFPLAVLIRFLPGFVFAKCVQFLSAARNGRLADCLRGNIDSFRCLPHVISARRGILRQSRVSSRTFAGYFRGNMFSESRSFRLGKFSVPPGLPS